MKYANVLNEWSLSLSSKFIFVPKFFFGKLFWNELKTHKILVGERWGGATPYKTHLYWLVCQEKPTTVSSFTFDTHLICTVEFKMIEIGPRGRWKRSFIFQTSHFSQKSTKSEIYGHTAGQQFVHEKSFSKDLRWER